MPPRSGPPPVVTTSMTSRAPRLNVDSLRWSRSMYHGSDVAGDADGEEDEEDGEDETDEIEDETGGRGRGAGKTSTTKTLLALIHSSEAPWPDRVEVLVNALIALEADRGGGYEVLVVLDSFGEPMDRNVCKVGR